jgi:hypothetical protein
MPPPARLTTARSEGRQDGEGRHDHDSTPGHHHPDRAGAKREAEAMRIYCTFSPAPQPPL